MDDRAVQYGMLKGWLIAKDAPPEIMTALDALQNAGETVTHSGPVILPVSLKPVTTADEPEPVPKARKRPQWTPEQRAAAAERMRRIQAMRGKTRPEPKAEHDDPGEALAPLDPPVGGAAQDTTMPKR